MTKKKRNELLAGAMILGVGILFISALYTVIKNTPATTGNNILIDPCETEDKEDLEERMWLAAEAGDYALAAKLRDRLKQLNSIK